MRARPTSSPDKLVPPYHHHLALAQHFMADNTEAKEKQGGSRGWLSTLFLNPLYQILSLIGRGARPVAPVIIPVAICTIAIPILLLFSLSSGFYVWKSVAVGWAAPLYLQYGYVTIVTIHNVA